MENYNFWADVLTTFRSSSDLVKCVWLLSSAVFVFSVVLLVRSVFLVKNPTQCLFPDDAVLNQLLKSTEMLKQGRRIH